MLARAGVGEGAWLNVGVAARLLAYTVLVRDDGRYANHISMIVHKPHI